ncbi:hypothetical protein SteCoe_18501 [Stentor coeruleus]|uniref:Methyltransferase small domain-containing protein n=1 Tax=Stentor coeruleus TaxID=5963 RepID=A0A1R2BWD7_9CILI|nr:hypothetical protein SteCoe_18501 [Stentor coeruleus]
MEGLFDSEFEFEEEIIEGVRLKLKPRDAGQVDSQVHLTLWPAAIELCRQCLVYVDEEKRVLELGAGTGLVGIYVAKNKGCKMVITDGNEESVELIKENAKINSVNIIAEKFLWGGPAIESDIILGSDIIYSRSMVLPLLSTIKATLAPSAICLLANHTIRFNSLESLFYETCNQLGLIVKSLSSITDPLIKVFYLTHI